MKIFILIFLFIPFMLSAGNSVLVGNFDASGEDDVYAGNEWNNAPAVSAFRYSGTQIIYTPEQLSAMKGKQIERLTFKYVNGGSDRYEGRVTVSLMEIGVSEFLEDPTLKHIKWIRYENGGPTVSKDVILDGREGTVEFDFSSEPYYYTGQSLLVTVTAEATAQSPLLKFVHNGDTESEKWRVLTYGSDSESFASGIESMGNSYIHDSSVGSRLAAAPAVCIDYSEKTVEQAFSGGDGTESFPYLISTVDDVRELDRWTNEGKTRGIFFLLTTDLTLPENVYIGTKSDFCGVFDGGNHCITIDIATTSGYVALFGSAIGATIRNLQVDGNVEGTGYVAGVVANPANGTLVENVVNFCDVTAYGSSYVAGVAANMVTLTGSKGCQILQCANYGTITAENCTVAGGVVGYSGQQVGNEIGRVANYGLMDVHGYKVAGVVGNSMYDDDIHEALNFGTTTHRDISGTLGSPRAPYRNCFYNSQYFDSHYKYPNQMKLVSEMIGSGLKNSESGHGLGQDFWVFAEQCFPLLKVCGSENSARCKLYAAPLMLAEGNTLSNVDKPFVAVSSHGVKWNSLYGKIQIDDMGNAIPVAVGKDILRASLDGYERMIEVTVTDCSSVIGQMQSSNEVFAGENCLLFTIVEEAGMEVQIYDLSGICLRQLSLTKGTYREAFLPGIYIVKLSDKVVKTMVR